MLHWLVYAHTNRPQHSIMRDTTNGDQGLMATPSTSEQWSLTTPGEQLVKIAARIVRHGRYVVFQLAEVAVPRALFAEIPPSDRVAQAEAISDMTARPSVSASPQERCAQTAPWEPRRLGPRGAPRITSSGPQGLVARAHGEHDGRCGTGIGGIPIRANRHPGNVG
jgi:hypothetical protein